MQLTHYIWTECLFISLQWSNYQLIQLLKMLCNCCITLNAQFLWKIMNNITFLDYESNWGLSVFSFKMPVVGRENPLKFYIIVITVFYNYFCTNNRTFTSFFKTLDTKLKTVIICNKAYPMFKTLHIAFISLKKPCICRSIGSKY